MSFKAHIGLDCSDLMSSKRFFQRCGFSLAFSDNDHNTACLENEKFEINLFEMPEFKGYSELKQLRCLHLGFQVPTKKQLLEIHESISRDYQAQPPEERLDGDMFFFVRGPDDMRVEFFYGTHEKMRAKYGK